MEIEVIDRKSIIFRLGENEYQFVKPNILYKNFNKRIKANIKGSTLGWHIEGLFLSYNKLREKFIKW